MEEEAEMTQDMPAAADTPTAPGYSFDDEPTTLAQIDIGSLTSEVSGNFFRSAKWCADGSAILATAEDRLLRVYQTPPADGSFGSPNTIKCPDAIVSTLWYPSASFKTPESFCFVAGVRDSPVRLIDGSDGRTRATYPIVDHRERMIAPHAMAFNAEASKLYCGFDGAIEVFDVSTPGHDTSDRLKLAYAKNQDGGQKGIVSALAFVPDYSGTFAAGNLNSTAALYTEDTGATPVALVEGIDGGGVTQVAFNPVQPTTMLIASRRSSSIQVYDTRDLSAPVVRLPRDADTNQRLDFGIDPWGQYLAAGDQSGTVKVWDLSDLASGASILERNLHKVAVGSVQMHPFQPWLLTVSGSRHNQAEVFADDSSDSSSDESLESLDDSDEAQSPENLWSTRKVRPSDASIRLWSFSPKPPDP